MIAPAMAVLTASWIDLVNASTNVSSVNSRADVVGRRLAARGGERADGDDGRRQDQEQRDVHMERDECEVVPRSAEAARAGPARGEAGCLCRWLAGRACRCIGHRGAPVINKAR